MLWFLWSRGAQVEAHPGELPAQGLLKGTTLVDYRQPEADSPFFVQEIISANSGRAKIHTIGVTPDSGPEAFLKALAAKNGGRYRRVY